MAVLILVVAVYLLAPMILRSVVGSLAIGLAALLWRRQHCYARSLVAHSRHDHCSHKYSDHPSTGEERAHLAAALGSTMAIVSLTSLLPQASFTGALIARRFG